MRYLIRLTVIGLLILGILAAGSLLVYLGIYRFGVKAPPTFRNETAAEQFGLLEVKNFDAQGWLEQHRYHERAERELAPLIIQLERAIMFPYEQTLDEAWRATGPMAAELSRAAKSSWWSNPMGWWNGARMLSTNRAQNIFRRHLRLKPRLQAAAQMASERATRLLEKAFGELNHNLRKDLIQAGLQPDQLGLIPDRTVTRDRDRLRDAIIAHHNTGMRDVANTALMGAGAVVAVTIVPATLSSGAVGAGVSVTIGIAVGGVLFEIRAPAVTLATQQYAQEQLTHLEAAIAASVQAELLKAWPTMVNSYRDTLIKRVKELDDLPYLERALL